MNEIEVKKMNEKIVLPINDTPDIQSFHYLAFPLSIITAKVEMKPWMYSKYINCSCVINDEMKLTLSDDDWLLLHSGVYKGQYFMINKEMLPREKLNIISIVKTMLKNGYYVLGHFNEFYIPNKHAYQKRDYDHDFLLYGYDDEINAFHSIGYTMNQSNYGSFVIEYNCFYDACCNVTGENLNLNFVKLKPDFKKDIDIGEIKKQLSEYLNSVSTYYEHLCKNSQSPSNRTYGYNAVCDALNDWKERARNSEYILLSSTRALMEHKQIMKKRLEYLIENGYLLLPTELLQKYGDIVTYTQTFFNKSIKYNMVYSTEKMITAINELENLIKDEYYILEKVYTNLKTNE